MISGNGIRLRALERADLRGLRRRAEWSTAPPPAPAGADGAWLDAAAARGERLFAVEDAPGLLLGAAAFTEIDWKNRSVECRAALHAGGRKSFEEALRLLGAFAFEELNLHRVSVRVLKDNTAAAAACRRAGFREEGTARGGARQGAGFADVLLMGRITVQDMRYLPG